MVLVNFIARNFGAQIFHARLKTTLCYVSYLFSSPPERQMEGMRISLEFIAVIEQTFSS